MKAIHNFFYIFRISSAVKHKTLYKKLEKLIDLNNQIMLAAHLCPYCDQILNMKTDWYLGLSELNDDFYFKLILSEETMNESMNESFHKYFIRKKFDAFCKSLSIIKQTLNSSINIIEINHFMKILA